MTAPVRRPTDIRPRSWLEVRWRQFRNAPRPVVRAVLSSLVVAMVLGLGYLLYDLAIRRGAVLPGGDLRTLYLVLGLAISLREIARREIAGSPGIQRAARAEAA